ncbi:MAG: hypothetical protein ACJAZ0_000070 [Halioglobus sp.]|jgi:hypothetical protein
MKKSTKAALLSALIFPGVGHMFLKKKIPGVALISASFVAIYYLASKAMEKALQITEKIQSGDISLDIAAMTELVTKNPTGVDAQVIDIATYTFITFWLFGIIDSYRLGRAGEKKDEALLGS